MPLSTVTSSQRVSSSVCTCSLTEWCILGKNLGQDFKPHIISFPPRSQTLQQIFRSTWHKAVSTKLCSTSQDRGSYIGAVSLGNQYKAEGEREDTFLIWYHQTSSADKTTAALNARSVQKSDCFTLQLQKSTFLAHQYDGTSSNQEFAHRSESAQLTLPDLGPIQKTSHLRTAN